MRRETGERMPTPLAEISVVQAWMGATAELRCACVRSHPLDTGMVSRLAGGFGWESWKTQQDPFE